ncbi:MAG: thioredoxin family protein [Deltaproteobacteria bacterium]
MTEDAIKQIMINNRLVGIVGLEKAISEAVKFHADKNDDEISIFLINAAAAKNYIPSSARSEYGHALLRAYKVAMNLPVDPEPSTGLTILVLGMGCARCDQLQSDIRDVLSELQIAADIRHVTDIKEMSRFGIMGTPALVMNDKVVSVGVVPPKSQLRQWITEACSR